MFPPKLSSHTHFRPRAEMALLLRDIGMDSAAILKIKKDQALDREAFSEFLKEEWGEATERKAKLALEALAARQTGDSKRGESLLTVNPMGAS
jgi:hypothetical protein